MVDARTGRLHLEQALPVIAAGKPLFIDKPLAASVEDVVAIAAAAERAGVPLFSSSTLRYTPDVDSVRAGGIGAVLGAHTYSPAVIEPTHPDLFWYGIHAAEMLFAVMGTGCETVTRVHRPGTDVVTCVWEDGRIGTMRGLRDGRTGYGGTAFGADAIKTLNYRGGYDGLTQRVAEFFATGVSPVPIEETIEIFAFLAAAEESKARDGAPVPLAEVLREARAAVERRP